MSKLFQFYLLSFFFLSKSFPQNSMALLMSCYNALKLDVISQCSFFLLRRISLPYDHPVNYAHPFITTTFCSPQKSPQILLSENAITTTNEHLLESSVIIFLVELSRLYYYMRNFCNLIGLEQWYFSLI